ncbi:MAG: sulfatase-like hydrolase/transferase, partial [Rikenellaceae bacterium]
MKPTNKIILATGALTLVANVGVYAAKRQSSERPNIIFILTDDQRYDLLNFTGNPHIQTPNLEQLAKDGVFFTNAHVSTAISSPSRTCILTGKYERNHGLNFNSGTSLSDAAWNECYPMVLRESGYYTGYIGKNHTPIGKDGYDTGLMDESYDYWYGSHQNVGFYPQTQHDIYKGAKSTTQVEVLEEGVMDFLDPNERNLAGAVSFLKSRPADQPFFLNLCFNLPHNSSVQAMKMKTTDPETYRTLHRNADGTPADYVDAPKNYIAKKDIKIPRLPHSIHPVENRQSSYKYVNTVDSVIEWKCREMEVIAGIDMLIGNLRDELKRQGIDDNTIIIFTSDHGIFKGEYGMGGKALCYEICTRVPMFIYDPRNPKKMAGQFRDDLVLALDVAPTILDYAGAPIPDSYQGASLAPLVEKRADRVRDYLFTENLWSTQFGNPRCESVQDKEWKYIRYYENKNQYAIQSSSNAADLGLKGNVAYNVGLSDAIMYRNFVEARVKYHEEPVYEELFNLKDDEWEETNVIGDKKNSAILEKMRKECDIQLKMARGEG